ncbi:MAG: hypothetical protein AAGA03_07595 [Planctomycetota bacterium]
MPESDTADVQSIESLKDEYAKLNERRIQTQTQLESAETRLRELQQEADEQFGTHDVEQLAMQLAEMERENEKRRREYQGLLESIQNDLAEIERKAELDAEAAE